MLSSSSSSSSSNQSSLTDPGINNINKNRLVCVVAATGKQGSSICKNLIEEGFSVRGTTRDASSSKCDELKKLGVSMVSADMDDKRSLQNAFKGCWAVYSVTDFYQDKVKSNPELEYVQGKNTVDAAVEEKVQYFIYSALDNVKNISGGKLSKVFHFTNKSRVGEYAKQQNDIKTILVYPAFYMQNFQGMMPLKRNDQNQVVFSFPFSGSVRLPIVDCRDFGKVVAAILKNPDTYVGREIIMCGEYTSLHDLVAKFQGATNQPAVYYQCTEDEMRSQLPADLKDEFIEMFRWFNEYGYYGGRKVEEGIQECERIVQQDNKHMLNFREWLISTGWKGPDKSILQNIKSSASHLIENVKQAIHQ